MEETEKDLSQVPLEGTLLAYIRGKATEEEIKETECWLRDDEANEKILLQIATLYFARNRQERIEKRNSLKAFDIGQQRIRSRKRKTVIVRISAIAACFAGVLLLSTLIGHWGESDNVPQSSFITIQANSGMRSQFNLPDGTTIYLNSGSKFTYPVSFDKEQRTVSLDGEAYFKVTHNPDCPFVVNFLNDRMQVRVLGTEFNLHAYGNELDIIATLVSGQIDVMFRDSFNQSQEQSLYPSEKAIYNLSSGKLSVEKVDTQYETAWMDGKLMFKNSPLPDVLKKLSSFYNVKFEVKDAAINSYRLTGVFDNRQLFQVLDYLKLSSRINYRINQATEDDSLRVKYTIVTLY